MSKKSSSGSGWFSVIFGSGIVFIIGLGFSLTMTKLVGKDTKANKEENKPKINLVELNKNISNVANIDNFNAKNFSITSKENTHQFVFGGTINDVENTTEVIYANTTFDVSAETVNEVLQAIKKMVNTEKQKVDFENYHTLEASTKDGEEALASFVDVLNNAVKNSLKAEVQEVGKVEEIENATKTYYDKSEIRSVQVVGISDVVSDEKANKSIFYIDTLQERMLPNGDYETQVYKAKIEVDGANLSPAEAYAKYLTGNHSKFSVVPINKESEEIYQFPQRGE